MVIELITRRDLQLARELVEKSDLAFEENFDNLVGIYEGRQLIAVGARDKNVLKMLVIEPEFQGGTLLGELIGELERLGYRDGFDSFFIYTPPRNIASFQAMNFTLLVNHHKVALLEYGKGLGRYLDSKRHLVRPGENGAVVVNCNPFTLGHRYLIEEAAGQVDCLYVFVVREDSSIFPFETRLRLVEEGVKDLPNVVVLDSSHYAISSVTFPAYFLKEDDPVTEIQMQIDLVLFAKYLAPYFGIVRRFIGTEPYCRTTRLYSEAMKWALLPFGVETVQIERKKVGGEPISAFRVREAMRQEAFETLRRLLPPSTLNYILSDEARQIRERLLNYQRRH